MGRIVVDARGESGRTIEFQTTPQYQEQLVQAGVTVESWLQKAVSSDEFFVMTLSGTISAVAAGVILEWIKSIISADKTAGQKAQHITLVDENARKRYDLRTEADKCIEDVRGRYFDTKG